VAVMVLWSWDWIRITSWRAQNQVIYLSTLPWKLYLQLPFKHIRVNCLPSRQFIGSGKFRFWLVIREFFVSGQSMTK